MGASLSARTQIPLREHPAGTNAICGGDGLSGYIQVLGTTEASQCPSSMGQNTGNYRSFGYLKEWNSTKWCGICSSDLTYLKSNLLG